MRKKREINSISIEAQIEKILQEINIESKETQRVGLNGRSVSSKIHSAKYLNDTKRTLLNLGKFAKEKNQIDDISKINIKIIKAWIQSKNISYRSASNYLSILNKVKKYLNITSAGIQRFRDELKSQLERPKNQTRAYKNLDKVKIPEKYQIAFELQRDYGLKISSATNINPEEQLKGNVLYFEEFGRKQLNRELTPELAQKIRETAKNGGYKVPYRSYQEALQKAIEKTRQKWNGTEGIRHSYVQRKLEEGMTKKELAKELGYNREEGIRVYLR